jgi:broad specificity phosphatase PhoE
MADIARRVSQAARELGMSTKEVLTLAHQGTLGYVLRDGIAHIPPAAIQEYLATAS